MDHSMEARETAAPTSGDFIKRQPLLALSGIGTALGSLAALIRKVSKISPLKGLKYPKLYKQLPKYLRSNYVKYPALAILLVASTRRIRHMLSN